MSPEIAVISCGDSNFGRPGGANRRPKSFSTFVYGHPRQAVVDLLSVAIPKRRSEAITVYRLPGDRETSSTTA